MATPEQLKETDAITTEIRQLEARVQDLYKQRAGRIFLEEGNPSEPGWRCLGYCVSCGRNVVDAAAGFVTCFSCTGGG